MPRDFKQDKLAARLTAGRRLISPPKAHGSAWSWSRLVVLDDGPVPLLTLLAREIYPEWDPRTQTAFWRDHDPTHETAANVVLADISFGKRKKGRSPWGKSGTPAYWKAYRLSKHEKLKAYHKNRSRQIRAHARIFKEASERGEVITEVKQKTALDDILDLAKGKRRE
jgi:hypothetical protein